MGFHTAIRSRAFRSQSSFRISRALDFPRRIRRDSNGHRRAGIVAENEDRGGCSAETQIGRGGAAEEGRGDHSKAVAISQKKLSTSLNDLVLIFDHFRSPMFQIDSLISAI